MGKKCVLQESIQAFEESDELNDFNWNIFFVEQLISIIILLKFL